MVVSVTVDFGIFIVSLSSIVRIRKTGILPCFFLI